MDGAFRASQASAPIPRSRIWRDDMPRKITLNREIAKLLSTSALAAPSGAARAYSLSKAPAPLSGRR